MSYLNELAKLRLLRENSFCSMCKLDTWNGLPLILELDHINGNNKDYEDSNLRLLCPNCHSQTPTWRGRNIKRRIVSDDELISALESTTSIRAALIKVGLTPKGKNYTRAGILSNIAQKQSLDTSNSQYGTIWITKFKTNKKIKKSLLEEYLTQGWALGRYIENLKMPSTKGRYWITNGSLHRMINPGELIPEGWFKGRCR